MLPTPTRGDGTGGGRPATAKRRWPNSEDSLRDAARTLLPTPSAYESTPTDEFVDEVRANLDDPHSRLYLPGRKWHSQRTLSRMAPLLPTPAAADSQRGPDYAAATREETGGDSLTTTVAKLLPTPTAGDSRSSGSRNLEGSKAHAGVSLTDVVRTGDSTTPRMLPTPTARDAKGGNGPNYQREGGDSLPNAMRLLPTPQAADGAGGPQLGYAWCWPPTR